MPKAPGFHCRGEMWVLEMVSTWGDVSFITLSKLSSLVKIHLNFDLHAK